MSRRIVNPKECYSVQQRVPRIEINSSGKEKQIGFSWIPVGRRGFEEKIKAEKFMKRVKKTGRVNMGHYTQEVTSRLRIRKVPYYHVKC
jgi:hypothetical protein